MSEAKLFTADMDCAVKNSTKPPESWLGLDNSAVLVALSGELRQGGCAMRWIRIFIAAPQNCQQWLSPGPKANGVRSHRR